MTREEFIPQCRQLFELNALPCSDEQAEKLFTLTERMLEVNKTMNLTAIKDEKAIILKHYVDCASIIPYIPENSRIIDLGCGAGFPTLPLAVFRPDLLITALDSTAKRVNYVSETAKLLGLTNIKAIAGRAEEYAHKEEYRESFDMATARAVASLPILCELCLPFIKVGGIMLAMKSQQAADELAASDRCIKLCGGNEGKIISCDLRSEDGENEERNLIFIKKSQKTQPIYPRHFSKISKKPL